MPRRQVMPPAMMRVSAPLPLTRRWEKRHCHQGPSALEYSVVIPAAAASMAAWVPGVGSSNAMVGVSSQPPPALGAQRSTLFFHVE